MSTKRISMLVLVVLLVSFCACSKTQQANEPKVDPSKLPFAEDLAYLKIELPKKHANLFTKISQEDFNASIDKVIAKADTLTDEEEMVALEQIIASVGDAHTNIDYRDGYQYPLIFTMIDGDIYIIKTTKELEEMNFSKVTKIDGVDIKTIIEQLTTLIPHENAGWVKMMLPERLHYPAYLYGLGLIKDKTTSTFTIEKDGQAKNYTVEACANNISYEDTNVKPVLTGQYEKNYIYQYLPDSKSLYFQYNSCREMSSQAFQDFNTEMFDCMEKNEVNRIIVDVRNNLGGNSEVLNPFTDQIGDYLKEHPGVKVFILIGRRTFSGGMFAIYRTKDAVPDAILVGEATGGAIDFFAEIKTMQLPKTRVTISYSTKYFEFSKDFTYQNKGADTCEPDVNIQPTIEEFRDGKDPVLDYALEN